MNRPCAEVIGDPIAHSKSPLIHGFWLDKLGIDAEYRACHVRPEGLGTYLASRRTDRNWRGCNVTIPHKLAVLQHVDERQDTVLDAGAANTIVRTEAGLRAANTDIDGILDALPVDLMPQNANVCILGTGGAARAALAACRQRRVGAVWIAARNESAAGVLHREFGLNGGVCSLDSASAIQSAHVIMNATSLGMTGKDPMPQAILAHVQQAAEHAVVFDMVYAPLETVLLSVARRRGLRTVDGLAMLIGQAAAAFERFFGKAAPREYDAQLREMLTR